jgi:uncharacterized repeat protein (TIGR01451 family)
LTLQDGLFLSNVTDGTGGGLWSFDTVALTGTRFISNTAVDFGGGAVVQAGATVHTAVFQGNHCTASFCSGGGLYATGSILDVVDSQFISNTADGYGGGGLLVTGPATVQGGLFQGNNTMTSTTGPFTVGGGGMLAFNTLALTGTQFIGNQSAGYGGGLLHEGGTARVVNALLVGNSAGTGGDDLAVDSILNAPESLTLLHATIVEPAGAPGGAAVVVITGTLNVTNSIFSNFAVGISRTAPAIATEDYNLYSGVGAPTAGGVASGGHSLVGNPAFRNPSLGDYHLAFGSVALNAAVNAGVAIDADGDPRPIGSGSDMGYDEARLVALTLSKTDGQSTASPGDPLTYTIMVNNAGPYPATGIAVSDSLPSGLAPGTWTCLASAGSACPASGSGSISATATIAGGSFVQFTLHVTVAGNASGTINNVVSVIVPAGLVNTNAPNSSASDSTTIVGGMQKIYLPLLMR